MNNNEVVLAEIKESHADFFGQISEIPVLDINDVNATALCNLLLHGSSQLNLVSNSIILDATISYIRTTNRFQ